MAKHRSTFRVRKDEPLSEDEYARTYGYLVALLVAAALILIWVYLRPSQSAKADSNDAQDNWCSLLLYVFGIPAVGGVVICIVINIFYSLYLLNWNIHKKR